MVLLRGLSALIEVVAVVFMYRLTRLEAAFRLNSFLGLIGPLIFLGVSALGLAGLVGKVALGRLVLTAVGVLLVLLGTR